MSYEIIYDKQFIKVQSPKGVDGSTKDMFIPMVLAGSNNCYEWSPNGKERRARSWFPWTLDVGLMGEEFQFLGYWNESRNEIIKRNEARERDEWYDQYDDKSFGYWTGISVGSKGTHRTTFKNITGIFTTGIKKALTIEQLASEGVGVIVKSGYITRDKDVEPFSRVVKNDAELFEALDECRKHLGDSGVTTTIDFGGMWEEKPKRLRKKFFTPEPRLRVPKLFDKTYKISVNGGSYFVKETGRHMYHNYEGKLFTSKAKAEKKLAQLLSKRYVNVEFKLVEFNEPVEVMV